MNGTKLSRENLACSTLHYQHNGWNLQDAMSSIACIGYRGIEISFDEHIPPKEVWDNRKQVHKNLEKLNLQIATLTLPGAWVGEREKIERSKEFFTWILNIGNYFDVSFLVIVSGPWPEGFDREKGWSQITENFRWIIKKADQKRIRVAVEAVAEWPIGNMETFLKIQQAVGDDLYANVDPSNYSLGGDDPVEVVRKLRDKIIGAHIKDSRQEAGKRLYTPIGEGTIDFDGFLSALGDIGYKGWLSVEYEGFFCGYHKDPVRAAKDSFQFMVNLFKREDHDGILQ